MSITCTVCVQTAMLTLLPSVVPCLQPSISFEQQLGQQAMASMQFAQQLIPVPAEHARPSDRRSPAKQAPAELDLQTR